MALWTQEQAIAYEAALEAINDVIAGYSEQLEREETASNDTRVAWLNMRIDQAVEVHGSLNVLDDKNVRQALFEFSAIIRAREEGR